MDSYDYLLHQIAEKLDNDATRVTKLFSDHTVLQTLENVTWPATRMPGSISCESPSTDTTSCESRKDSYRATSRAVSPMRRRSESFKTYKKQRNIIFNSSTRRSWHQRRFSLRMSKCRHVRRWSFVRYCCGNCRSLSRRDAATATRGYLGIDRRRRWSLDLAGLPIPKTNNQRAKSATAGLHVAIALR
jgi:hypothetical protein